MSTAAHLLVQACLEYNWSAQLKVEGIDMHKLHVSQLAMC